MMSKRFLLLPLLIVVVVASSVAYNFSKPAGGTKFSKVDTASFHWSGQKEGETIEIEPDWSASVAAPYVPPFERFSLARGIDEAIKRLNGKGPLLPTLLPEGIKYADVYVGPDVIICYSYGGAEDYRSGNMGIEISPGPRRVPTPEELKPYLYPDQKLIQIGDKWVVITDEAHDWERGELYILATFYCDNLRYSVWARPPLTSQDVIKVIENMKTY